MNHYLWCRLAKLGIVTSAVLYQPKLSPKPIQFQGKGTQSPLSKRKASKNLQTHFKNTTLKCNVARKRTSVGKLVKLN